MKITMKRILARLEHSSGAALILAITVLIVLTVIGVAALNISSLQVKMVHNVRLFNMAFYRADGALQVSVPVLEEAVAQRGFVQEPYNYKGTTDVKVKDADFYREKDVGEVGAYINQSVSLPDGDEDSEDDNNGDRSDDLVQVTATNPDIQISGTVEGVVDVDNLGTSADKGFSILMSMGYEGLGKGVAGGGASRFYEINTRGEGPLGSQSRIKGVYRHKI